MIVLEVSLLPPQGGDDDLAGGMGNDKTYEAFFAKHFPEKSEQEITLAGYRYREGLTQKQLAELTGINRRHISEMEHGKRPIGKENAKKLAKVLHCDYRSLL